MATIEEQRAQVAAFRAAFLKSATPPIGEVYKQFASRPPVRGPVWIAQDDFRVSNESRVRDSVFDAILFASTEPITLATAADVPVCDVHAEWVGQRQGVERNAKLPSDLSEAQLFERLQAEVENDLTIIYAHGGGS